MYIERKEKCFGWFGFGKKKKAEQLAREEAISKNSYKAGGKNTREAMKRLKRIKRGSLIRKAKNIGKIGLAATGVAALGYGLSKANKLYKKESQDSGLGRRDNVDVFKLRHLNNGATRDLLRDKLSNDKRYYNKLDNIRTATGGLIGGAMGLGFTAKGKSLKSSLINAGLGATAGAILNRGLSRRSNKINKKITDDRISGRYGQGIAIDEKNRRNRGLDLINVSEGKMSNSDFANKWYNKE